MWYLIKERIHKREMSYNQHCVGYLVFAYTATQYDHTSFAGFTRKLIQLADVANNVQDETRRSKGVEVDHVTD